MMTAFTTAINAATCPEMIGLYLGGMMFFLGLVPAIGARMITVNLETE